MKMMGRADKLNKMKMPGKPVAEADAMADMDAAMQDMPSEGMDEAMPADEMVGEAAPADMLADISDDDLLAEIKKRGLKPDQVSGAKADQDMEDIEA